ncbi:hypothetical protein ASE03_21310 [Kitasatospora sp. Root187]|uniref:hypothetical protein n=2 Tax=unclassified Kitasatospora TaxID=2633591 RepID=UPI00070E6473|nr:hypothetical protein [Kitasatospora sp. Root187]KRB73730.1 hypothetical protein ASE03_21310 [Kitasatospora sp. Root187]
MMPNRPALRVPAALKGEADADSLDALVSSSRRMGLFWPAYAIPAEPVPTAPAGVSVPPRTRRLVAGMSEYGA